jgi:N-acetylneuraminic acid mutarotase
MKEAVEVGQLPFGNYASSTISHKPGEALIFGGYNVGNKVVHYNRNGSVANELSGHRLPKDVYLASAVYYSTPETESVFLFGGGVSCNKDIIKYNVKTGKSEILNETLPFGLFGSNALLVSKYIYVFGGSSKRACEEVSLSVNVVRFNPENNEIESLVVNGFPSSLRYFSAVYIKNLKRAYFFGGIDDDTINYRNQILKLQF